jgi:hypothetical protein
LLQRAILDGIEALRLAFVPPTFGAVVVVATLLLLAKGAMAGPWAQAGDATLRSDVEILAAAGAIDDVTMSWPLPWGGVLSRLDDAGALEGMPEYIRDAATRVRGRALVETRRDTFRATMMFDAASTPNVVRGFDAMGREAVQGQVSAEYMWDTTTVHLAVGAQTVNKKDHQVFMPDGSYLAQEIGNAAIYAGYVTHWWGPGWISALSLSNNARPVPQIGISRLSTAPFESPWLSWIGPWQLEFFAGVLDGPRLARNTIYSGVRFGFSPLPHLELGISRTDMMCGTGHPCSPIADYFNLQNDPAKANKVNDEATIDVRYSNTFEGIAYQLYAQAMNEDTNPIVHSGTSHLFGGSVWTPLFGGVGRLTLEYADSLATRDIWGGGIMHGVAYNNGGYLDGMRYRDRTLGFSLDSDSRLLSMQANFTDRDARSFTLTYHHADVSDPLNTAGNVVTTAPVTINLVQGRISLPLELGGQALRLDIEGRYQDDRPRPDKGSQASIEIALTAGL